MIEAIKARIRMCEKLLASHKDSKSTLTKGIVIGLKGELETLNGLLITAEKLQDLERSA